MAKQDAVNDDGNRGVVINCIAPGLFHTELAMTIDDKVIDALGNTVEFPKRLGKPSEFAQLVVQMAENDYFNGEEVRLDGSIRMRAK